MSFMDSLASNPSNSGIYGQPNNEPTDYGGILSVVNQLKDREMRDFKDKSTFMSDLSMKQDRMKRIYDMQDQQQQEGSVRSGRPGDTANNVVMGADPNAMTGYQKGELGVRQQANDLESQKINQTGRLGEQTLGIKQQQEELNKTKNEQINATKQADMERKINEANAKIEQAKAALAAKTQAGKDTIQAHKDLAAAVEERHKIEMDEKQRQFDITSKQHADQIKALQDKLDQAANTSTTTEQNPEGTKKVVTTKRGAGAKTVTVKGKDNKDYEIPSDKLDEWNATHAPSQ